MSEAAEAYAQQLCRIFGSNFRRVRRRAECSQQSMADRSGISRKMICAVERGSGNPSLHTLAGMALAIGNDVPALLMITTDPEAPG